MKRGGSGPPAGFTVSNHLKPRRDNHRGAERAMAAAHGCRRPSLPSAYAAAHVLKYKLPAFHRLKFLPALLSVPSGRYGSRTPIYCPNKSERVRPPVHQKKPLEQIKTRVCSSAQSRHTHTHTLICLGATPDCQIITSTRRASLKTWTHREGTRRARSPATRVSHVHTWELPGTTAHCHCCTNEPG